jgi:hypothetical protein
MNIDSEDKIKRYLSNARRKIRDVWNQTELSLDKVPIVEEEYFIFINSNKKYKLKKLAKKLNI